MDDTTRLLPAANYLRHLLLNEPAYRGLWMAKARRSGGSPNVTAVSAVLADYHWQHEYLLEGEPPSTDRSYKDRVARALSARSFTPSTARLIGHAFRMKRAHLDRLLDLVAAPASVPETWPTVGKDRTPRPYRTISLHELHTVGPDCRPSEHRTIRAIQALDDGVDVHPFVFDTPYARVHAVQGATAGPVEPFPDRQGLWMCRLHFLRPLKAGEFRFLEYVTTFDYPSVPPCELRRGSAYPLQTLSLRVTFSPPALPARVAECVWPSWESEAFEVNQLQLDDEHSINLVYEDNQPGLIQGIVWEWE